MNSTYYFQYSVNSRWDDHVLIQLMLKKFQRNTRLEELRNILPVCAELGKGVYGVVYEAKIKIREENKSSIAIKSISTLDRPNDREMIFSRMLREEIAYAYLNALVFLRICPNFALVHKSFLSRHQQRNNMYCFLLCMEKSDGNMREWVSSKNNYVGEPHIFMSSVFQIFMAIAAYGNYLNLVHNDLYLKNILYNRISKTTLIYHFRKHTYTLSQCEFLFKISDFGICSSPTYLKNNHQDMVHMSKECRHASSLMDFDFSNHILEYENIPHFARDSVIFLRSLLYMGDVHPTCKKWLYNSLKLLNDLKLHKASDLGDYVNTIFSRDFLQKSGLSPFLFQSRVETVDASTEIFRVDGNEDTKRSMIFLAKDYIDSGRSTSNGPTTPPSTLSTPATFF